MKKIKQIIYILNWPVVFLFGQFFLIAIFALLFQQIEYHQFFPNEMNSDSYNEKFSLFLEQYRAIIALLSTLVFYPVLKKQYQKVKTTTVISFRTFDIINLFAMGAAFAILYNGIVFTINDMIPIASYSKPNHLLSLWFTTCIIGPILEEYIYRGIVYSRLKQVVKSMQAILWTTLIFGLVHSGFTGIVYAMIINFMLIYVYELYGTLKASILFHVSANTVILFLGTMLNQCWYYKEIAILISIGVLLYGYKITKQRYEEKA